AREQEGDKPDPGDHQRDPAADCEEHAAAGRNHLAALLEPEVERPRVSEHRRSAGEDAAEMRDEDHADERGREALQRIERDHGDGEAAAVRAPDVGAADRAAAVTADVLAAEDERQPVAPGAGAEEVAPDHDEGEGHGLMPYASTQPSTTP